MSASNSLCLSVLCVFYFIKYYKFPTWFWSKFDQRLVLVLVFESPCTLIDVFSSVNIPRQSLWSERRFWVTLYTDVFSGVDIPWQSLWSQWRFWVTLYIDVFSGVDIPRQSLWGQWRLVGTSVVTHQDWQTKRCDPHHRHHQRRLICAGGVAAGSWRLQLGSLLPLGSCAAVSATWWWQPHFTNQVMLYYDCYYCISLVLRFPRDIQTL